MTGQETHLCFHLSARENLCHMEDTLAQIDTCCIKREASSQAPSDLIRITYREGAVQHELPGNSASTSPGF